MNHLVSFFNLILYQPLFNALILLYLYLPFKDFGLAVIVLTLLIRFLIYPLTAKAIRSQKALAQLQPKIKEVQEKYKEDKSKQAQAMLTLYKESGINPFASLLPLLIQIPLLIALFLVLRRATTPESMVYLYNFIPKPEQINFSFLGLVDLAKPSLVLALLAGVAQFFQSKFSLKQQVSLPQQEKGKRKTPDFASVLQKQMLYFFPVLTVLILWRLPSAIGLYWLISSLFAVGEQYLVNSKIKMQNEK
jgi:YidC/Oxa1 family membrane protein insertase